jgi:folate-dependent tRNA-U54 methylase TrmFO/GidA
MKANFGILPPLELKGKMGKRDKGKAYAERALADLTLALNETNLVITYDK